VTSTSTNIFGPRHTSRSKLTRAARALLGGALVTLATQALAWPDKPVTLVVPFPPGGSTDQLARTIAPKLQELWGQSVIVDNRAGATGTIGAQSVARAAPDGHTLLVTSLGPLVIVPHLFKKISYDPVKDFDYLTVALRSPNVLIVPANSPHKTVADVISAQRATPGKLTFSSAGNGSSDHLTAEIFWAQTGTTGVHVPYKGGAPAIADVIGGQVDGSFPNVNAVMTQINGGRVRALAITSDKRSPLLPTVPTLAEAGVKDMVIYSWQAIVAPKGLAPSLKAKIHADLIAAIRDPNVRSKFTGIGFELVGNSSAEFVKYQHEESARWKRLIEQRKIAAD
jgi:tripartite-type tricarboxylate transporter receptor subunit TctC